MTVGKTRNNTIDFLKFVFSWIIVFYHFYAPTNEHFVGGNFVVSFFVLVSGFFFFESYERNRSSIDESFPLQNFKKRFARFFPYTFLAYFVQFFVKRIWITWHSDGEITADRVVRWLANDIWEILLVDASGLNYGEYMLNTPVWYISALLLAEFVVACFLAWDSQKFLNYILPVTTMVGIGFLRNTENFKQNLWNGFTTSGTIRVLVILCVSYYCFKLSQKYGIADSLI